MNTYIMFCGGIQKIIFGYAEQSEKSSFSACTKLASLAIRNVHIEVSDDCLNVQADLNLGWTHIFKVTCVLMLRHVYYTPFCNNTVLFKAQQNDSDFV